VQLAAAQELELGVELADHAHLVTILEVEADTVPFDENRDAVLLEVRSRTYPGQHEKLWAVERARGKNDLAAGAHRPEDRRESGPGGPWPGSVWVRSVSVVLQQVFDADCPLSLEEHARHQRAGEHRQIVGKVADRRFDIVSGAVPAAVADGKGREEEAFATMRVAADVVRIETTIQEFMNEPANANRFGGGFDDVNQFIVRQHQERIGLRGRQPPVIAMAGQIVLGIQPARSIFTALEALEVASHPFARPR